jgi:hypothetical protein
MMISLPEPLKNTIEHFLTDVEQLFGNHSISLIVYGSASTEEYAPKKSDINILVVLDDDAIQNLRHAHQKISGWNKHRIRPLFLTESYIERSLDSFPIEFLNMKLAYHVVKGKDILQPLEIARQDIRLQCERELKGKLLHLRQRYVLTRGNKSELKFLIKESVDAFTAIFRALLFLKGRNIPSAKHEVVRQTCKDFDMDENLFAMLFSIRQGTLNPSRAELGNLLDSYIRQIDLLSRYVDAMQV